jgi:hypothetical protein
VNAGLALAPDAAIVLGIASTAMPFARTPGDAAERWLRVLRLHGEVGAALQALGVSEEPLRVSGEAERERAAPIIVEDRDAVAHVTEHAVRVASRRGAAGVATTDVLMAVMHVYGADFERVLRAHGTDCDEVIERLGATMPGSGSRAEHG